MRRRPADDFGISMDRHGRLPFKNQGRERGVDALMVSQSEDRQRRGKERRDVYLDLGRHGECPILIYERGR
ncbi:MAG TPA: hypothetical protein PLZ37_17155, partial [Nitrospira sp.]|nr:hypothetical protein [Nitrospira sp.]